MTLLVLGLTAPDLPAQHSQADLARSLLGLWPSYLTYALSFLVVGLFWMVHHEMMRELRRVDRRFLYLNLLSLLSIGVIPFVTVVLSRYVGEMVAVDAYAGVLALVALLQFVLWQYASRNHRLIEPAVDSHQITLRSVSCLLVAGVFVGSIAVSFLSPPAAQVTWVLTGLIHPISSRIPSPKKKGER
jgi:uncharacterized membrane protein